VQEFQPSRPRIRVLVADSSPISSQLLAEAIGKDPEVEALGFSSDPVEIGLITLRSCPDVLLVSAQMQEEPNCGLVLLQQLRTQRPNLKAVVLLDSPKPDVVVRAFRSGASGVFCRTTALDMLSKCIAAVHKGQIWASSEELGFVLAALTHSPQLRSLENRRLSLLSKRERDVVRCLVEGLTNRQIAETLGISQHTVKNYMFKIFEKLGMSNRVELVFHVLTGGNDVGYGESNPPREEAAATFSRDRKTRSSGGFGPAFAKLPQSNVRVSYNRDSPVSGTRLLGRG
jgi:two-component system nitrate/nitrite response regulator NarL